MLGGGARLQRSKCDITVSSSSPCTPSSSGRCAVTEQRDLRSFPRLTFGGSLIKRSTLPLHPLQPGATLGDETVGLKKQIPISQPETLFILPAPEPKSHRALRPLWRDLILKTWGEDPQRCPCCRGKMKNVGTIVKKEEIEFFLLLHGLWEGIISLPPPPDPPFDIETMEPLNVPIHQSWGDQTNPPPEDWWQDTPGEWEAPELPLDDGYTLVLDGDEPHELADFPTFSVG